MCVCVFIRKCYSVVVGQLVSRLIVNALYVATSQVYVM